jgi:hypothetical protein
MRVETTVVFRNADAEFEQYDMEDLKFRSFPIGENEPYFEIENNTLRRALEEYIQKMEEMTDLSHILINAKVVTKDNRYLAETKVDVMGFKNRDVDSMGNLTERLYDEFGSVLPCMKEVTH